MDVYLLLVREALVRGNTVAIPVSLPATPTHKNPIKTEALLSQMNQPLEAKLLSDLNTYSRLSICVCVFAHARAINSNQNFAGAPLVWT